MLTKHSGCEGNGELRGKDGEEPGGSIEERIDLIHAQVLRECVVEVMQQTRQLVETHLQTMWSHVIKINDWSISILFYSK